MIFLSSGEDYGRETNASISDYKYVNVYSIFQHFYQPSKYKPSENKRYTSDKNLEIFLYNFSEFPPLS